MTADHSWSDNMEIFLRGEGLWKNVKENPTKTRGPLGESLLSRDEFKEQNVDAVLSEEDTQKSDLALAYNLTPVDSSCMTMVLAVRCPGKA